MTNESLARTALIVDDDRAILDLLTDLLGDVGFATTTCDSGQPGLVALTQRQFDLLIIDQWLPDMNGLSICAAAHQRYGDAATVIMITADPRIERHVAALVTCADDVVSKPFDVDVLLAVIEAKLRRRVASTV